MTARKPVRLWPAVVIVILQLLLRFVAPRVNPDFMVYGLFAGPVAGLAIVLWWLLLSRAPWSERLGAVALMIALLFRYRLHFRRSRISCPLLQVRTVRN